MSSPFPTGPSPFRERPDLPRTRSRSKTPFIIAAVLCIVATAAISFALGFISGSWSAQGDEATSTNAGSTWASNNGTDDAKANGKKGNTPGGIGDAVESDGILLTVKDVTEGASIDYLEQGVKADRASTETLDAVAGGKLVTVTTEVENTGTEAWDLTCGFSIQAKLVDDQGRHFQPVESLYRIPGNPECNEQTNPGFTKTMKWAFEVPETAKGFALGFADPKINYDKLTYVKLD